MLELLILGEKLYQGELQSNEIPEVGWCVK